MHVRCSMPRSPATGCCGSSSPAAAGARPGAPRPGEGRLRLAVPRGGHRLALLEPPPDSPPTLSLGCVEYVPPRVLDGIKSLSYGANMLATRLAKERGFDEALLV